MPLLNKFCRPSGDPSVSLPWWNSLSQHAVLWNIQQNSKTVKETKCSWISWDWQAYTSSHGLVRVWYVHKYFINYNEYWKLSDNRVLICMLITLPCDIIIMLNFITLPCFLHARPSSRLPVFLSACPSVL